MQQSFCKEVTEALRAESIREFRRVVRGRHTRDSADILQRLGSSSDVWQHRLEKLGDRSRIFGTVFATKRADINRLAETRGLRKLSNLNGCPG